MKKVLKFFIVMISAAILFTACSSEDNPVIPDPSNGDPDPIVIKTPNSMKIEIISVTNFPTTKSNGDKWDYHVFPNSPTRRPDIYVELRPFGSNEHVFRSNLEEDALIETAYDSYDFTEPASSNGGSFPYSVPFNDTYTIELMDDDGLTADDWMGTISVKPNIHYDNDNAVNFTKRFTSGDVRITIKGRWLY